MIVDDSLTVRTIFKRMVESDKGLAVVATASSAERAIAQLRTTGVDVILLDLEMPGMGGLDALPAILQIAENAQVLVVSSLTEDGAEHTMTALSMGAADTMLKPRPGGFNEDYRSQLLAKIRALGHTSPDDQTVSERTNKVAAGERVLRGKKRPKVIAVGASTGGIHALNIMLRNLPPSLDLPILVTQHLPQSFIPVFARQIEMASARRTIIADDGVEIHPGEVTIATGHSHLTVRRVGDRFICKASSEPAASGCMPSVDPMLASLSSAYDGHVLAIILSGMGRDGLDGARALVSNGGTIFAQNAETSAVWGMPGAVAKEGLTSLVASPDELAAAIVEEALAAASK
ncbi:chemotaxis-specific protein-glutamate methyltransferase CheB [Erythrobacter ani]|uniref:Chemotaxis-specific protein-glutamate methyltransferase CheB n=1 Tax=Erythrobacter ani TaxID=2827235 RepID=A0ABS6SJ54_9SPHN|nr:chemotaxis-specific protein-glutamate methyltransferase CheB [Erythrobacter ani]MBV7265038.1 chemotaxis-specific protein-glutamate methyltransferase CheB [Erythrobacter ani]